MACQELSNFPVYPILLEEKIRTRVLTCLSFTVSDLLGCLDLFQMIRNAFDTVKPEIMQSPKITKIICLSSKVYPRSGLFPDLV